MKKYIISLCIIVEVLFIVFLGFRAFQSSELLNVKYADWEMIENDTTDLISPYFFIGKGSYLLDIDYSSAEDITVQISSAAENSLNLEEYSTVLHSQKHKEKVQFEAKGPTDNVQINLSANSSFSINDINIYRTPNMEKRTFVTFLFLIILINISWFNRIFIINNKTAIISILTIGFLSSLPLFSLGTEIGHDLDFHLMRIEGLSQELAAGHFPARIQSYYNYGHGYAVSIFYGDLLLYIPAILRVLGFQIIQSYKIYAFFINLTTAFLCFYTGKKIWKNDSISMFFSAAFTLSSYRFVDMYVRNAVGEYTAMMFFPIIALGIYEIYFRVKETEKLLNYRGLLFLTLGMSGIITCHILTTEMVCIFLIVFALFYIRKTINKTVITTLAVSVCTTAFCTAWFIVPFIDYYLTVPVRIRDTNNVTAQIQSTGAYITQYFSFFKSIFGTNGDLITERLSITPGLILMITLCFAIWIITNQRSNKTINKLTLASIILLFVSSNVFPWDFISNFRFGNFLAQIQFPWRWLMFACLLLSFLLGYILSIFESEQSICTSYKHIIYSGIAVLLLLQTAADTSSYATDALNIKSPKYSTDMDGTDYREYYLSGSDFFSLTFDVSGENVTYGKMCNQQGTDYTFKIMTDASSEVTLPILNYKGFVVTDNKGNNYRIKDGEQKEITVNLPNNFDGLLYVSFHEPIIWRVAEIISLLSLILIIYLVIKNKCRL